MSGSANCFTENPKITAASRNMHISGKEKTLAAKPVQEVLAAGGVVSDGEYDVIGKQVPCLSQFDLIAWTFNGVASELRLRSFRKRANHGPAVEQDSQNT